MSIDTITCTAGQLRKKCCDSITPELLATIASVTITDGLSPIQNDIPLAVSLMDPQGKTLWLSHTNEKHSTIATLFADNVTPYDGLFECAITLEGRFYYLAPVYSDNNILLAIVALSTKGVNSNILLALSHSLGREVSEKLKCHFYLQKLISEPIPESLFRDLDIQQVEKALIIEAALTCNGKIQHMHQALNMGRTTLWRKLKQYNIDIKTYKNL
ncbi:MULTISPECIES: helix-turn-helix domain-containing protein [Providencia]|nr:MULTISPECIES: helix-turn-helix domain-containing protein [Providencia]MBP6122116.1 transcriptional regulator [Providencia sp.]NIH21691.1 transcriptional regulator [Providencia heimbachae]SQH12301.1 DNA-binding transcriptional regulator DhaR [Providencia heimbachae]